jgi:4'-phosphopantetheinyl transferase
MARSVKPRPWPASCQLAPEEVHVWRASLDHPPIASNELAQCLSPDERAHAGRLRFDESRNRYNNSRGLLRVLIGGYLGMEPAEVRFTYGPHGKPGVGAAGGASLLQFNLSHAEELALYAFTCRWRVGIDVERIHPVSDLDTVIKRFFSRREAAELRALPAGRKLDAFFTAWTRKEAYLKAIGDGLTRPLQAVEASITPGEPARARCAHGEPSERARWRTEELRPATGYTAALVVEALQWRLILWSLASEWAVSEQ